MKVAYVSGSRAAEACDSKPLLLFHGDPQDSHPRLAAEDAAVLIDESRKLRANVDAAFRSGDPVERWAWSETVARQADDLSVEDGRAIASTLASAVVIEDDFRALGGELFALADLSELEMLDESDRALVGTLDVNALRAADQDSWRRVMDPDSALTVGADATHIPWPQGVRDRDEQRPLGVLPRPARLGD